MDVMWLALGATVFLGAVTQRITGMGFALVASPFLVLMLGAAAGVPFVQFMSLSVAVVVLASTYREVEWRKALLLLIPALLGVVPGILLFRAASPGILSILIGGLVLLALLAMQFGSKLSIFTGTGGMVGAGLLSGFMNVTSGIGGPAIALYALSTRWKHANYRASVQVYSIGLNGAGVVLHGVPRVEPDVWIIALVTLAAGLFLGHKLSQRVDDRLAMRLVAILAGAGALTAIIRGFTQL